MLLQKRSSAGVEYFCLYKDIRLLKSKFLEHREALVFHFDRVEMQ